MAVYQRSSQESDKWDPGWTGRHYPSLHRCVKDLMAHNFCGLSSSLFPPYNWWCWWPEKWIADLRFFPLSCQFVRSRPRLKMFLWQGSDTSPTSPSNLKLIGCLFPWLGFWWLWGSLFATQIKTSSWRHVSKTTERYAIDLRSFPTTSFKGQVWLYCRVCIDYRLYSTLYRP